MKMKPAALRTDDYRMVIDRGGKSHLYNMKNDPAEQNDLAKKQAQLLDSLMNVMKNWFTDVTQDGIKVPSIPMGYADAQTTSLPAPEATLTGDVAFEGDWGWANDYIINWQENDAATWQVDVQRGGTYDLKVLYNASPNFVGAVFEIKAGDRTREFTVSEAFDQAFKNSIDRVKRGEVYEKNWGEIFFGKVNLKRGESDITIRLKTVPEGGSFELKGLKINRS